MRESKDLNGEVVNWEEVKKAYEQVKEAKKDGVTSTVKRDNVKVYSMGKNNPIIRIDIREG